MRELHLIGRGEIEFIPELAVSSAELASRLVGELNRGRPAGTEPYAVAVDLPLVDALEEIEVYDHVVYFAHEDGSDLYLAATGREWGVRGSARVEVTEDHGHLWSVRGPRENVLRWAAGRQLVLRDERCPARVERRAGDLAGVRVA